MCILLKGITSLACAVSIQTVVQERPRTCGQLNSDPQGFNMCNIYLLTACSPKLLLLCKCTHSGWRKNHLQAYKFKSQDLFIVLIYVILPCSRYNFLLFICNFTQEWKASYSTLIFDKLFICHTIE